MSRHAASGARAFRVRRDIFDQSVWVISWVVDRYYQGTRGRFPRTYQRDTTEEGARRFAKKHGLELPP